MNYLRYTLLSLIICFSLAYSQSQKSDSTKTYHSEPVVVTGTQEGLSRKYVPASVSVVTSADLQSSGEISLLDALSEEVPGLFVPQRGLIGYGIENSAGTISIRGLGGNPTTEVLVMIDGIPQFMGLYGHPLSDSYLSEDAARVEVIRGPGSMLYGTNAMGGVINIITKRVNKMELSSPAEAVTARSTPRNITAASVIMTASSMYSSPATMIKLTEPGPIRVST